MKGMSYMYLFLKKDDYVLVYDLKPNEKKIADYRAIELSKLSLENMVYCATSNGEELLETRSILKSTDLNFNDGDEYHKFEIDTRMTIKDIKEYLDTYIKGEYNYSRVVKVLNENNEVVKYLLVPFSYQGKYYPGFNRKHIKNILEIPKSLYLLHMLYLGEYIALANEDIKDQLALFDLSNEPIDVLGVADFSYTKKNVATIKSSELILERKKKNSENN